MASASERNRAALAKLIRERQAKESRAKVRASERVLRDKTSSKDQRYRARKRIERERAFLGDLPLIAEASRWRAYSATIGPARRTAENARKFLSGFGSMGSTGIPNRMGGFNSSRQQQKDRQDFTRYVNRESSKLAQMTAPPRDRIYLINEEFWNVWREQYSDVYL